MKKQELLDEIYRLNELPNKYSYEDKDFWSIPYSKKQNLNRENKQFLENVLRVLKHNKGV